MSDLLFILRGLRPDAGALALMLYVVAWFGVVLYRQRRNRVAL